MSNIVTSPVFGVLVSLLAYKIGVHINKTTKLSVFNPLLISIILVITLLSIFNIRYDDYNNGGKIISFFLYPATVSLAIPIYRRFGLLKKNMKSIMISILCGQTAGIVTIILLSRYFGLSQVITISLIPKSITTPIGMALSTQMGGIPSLTVVAIIITGILGSMIAPYLFKIIKVEDKVAIGIAIGSASHAVGTAKALEIGEIEGAMSSISMTISGILTVFIAPVLWELSLKMFN